MVLINDPSEFAQNESNKFTDIFPQGNPVAKEIGLGTPF